MRYLSSLTAVAAVLLLLFTPFATAAKYQYPEAPEWDISEWINGEGKTVADLRGSVVVVDFFQLWCPGCNSFSLPLMEHWENVFADEIADGRLALISIHTVFEGHDYQNPTRLKEFVKEKGIKHLVGIDRHKDGDELPETMKIYRTRGTPEMAFIDKQGRIRFQHFGSFDTERAERYLRKLMAE